MGKDGKWQFQQGFPNNVVLRTHGHLSTWYPSHSHCTRDASDCGRSRSVEGLESRASPSPPHERRRTITDHVMCEKSTLTETLSHRVGETSFIWLHRSVQFVWSVEPERLPRPAHQIDSL